MSGDDVDGQTGNTKQDNKRIQRAVLASQENKWKKYLLETSLDDLLKDFRPCILGCTNGSSKKQNDRDKSLFQSPAGPNILG